MAWPDLTADDLETRARTYLNEATADFYTQAEVWRWLSIGAKDIAQKGLCVRRIIDAVTATSTRNVTADAYKVLHVEYVPSSGRTRMLTKIDPLRVGHYPTNGVTPQYWYEFSNAIGIEPIPDGAYNLRLYVADLPKMRHSTFPITAWDSGWTGSGTGTWSNGASVNAYTGTTGQAGVDTWGTALVTATSYTFIITVSGVSNCTLAIKAGTATSPTISTAGVHAVTLTSVGTALTLNATMTGATGGLTVDDLYILKEADFAATADQTDLPWQRLLVLYCVYNGLMKDRRLAQAQALEAVCSRELAYMRGNLIEVVPDGRTNLKYQ